MVSGDITPVVVILLCVSLLQLYSELALSKNKFTYNYFDMIKDLDKNSIFTIFGIINVTTIQCT